MIFYSIRLRSIQVKLKSGLPPFGQPAKGYLVQAICLGFMPLAGTRKKSGQASGGVCWRSGWLTGRLGIHSGGKPVAKGL